MHLLSYFLFATATVHMVMAGTDVKSIFTTSALVFIGAMTVFGTAALYLWRSEPARSGGAAGGENPGGDDDDGAPAEHARADEQERHDGERRLERRGPPTPTRSAMPTPTVTSHAGTDLLQASGADAMPVTSQPGDEAHRERPQHAARSRRRRCPE